MANPKNKYVTPRPDGKWQVKSEGKARPSRVTDTKAEAEKIGREQAKNSEGSLRVQKKDGTFQYESSFGNDPCPPKG